MLLSALVSLCMSLYNDPIAEAARKAIIRRFPECGIEKGQVILASIPSEGKFDVYEVFSEKGILHVKGNSPVAICHGFHEWLVQNGFGMFGWGSRRIAWPSIIPDTKVFRIVSPVEHHYNYNVVTFGYTMPYWDWNQWEHELDWMAFHGVDMPLALVAFEAIAYRVWRKMGLTEDEINAFYTGPAHLPWQRMGNIQGVDGHLNDQWNDIQVELQHKILDRVDELGMTPICPAFPGFIPRGILRLYPDVKAYRLKWDNFPPECCGLLLSPKESLFKEIGTEYVKEYEVEFGAHRYYLADSFNEMQLPGEKHEKLEFLKKTAETIYGSIRDANENAVWVMQGWMFGYNRDIWDEESVAAILSPVPDDRMLLLDLATDYNKYVWNNGFNWDFYEGFYGKMWVYSVIPNMGGKTPFTGYIDYYANGHLTALRSKNRGNMVAIGLAPEGFENNEMLYELFTHAMWMSNETDVDEWLETYAKARYGAYPKELKESWHILRSSWYNSFVDWPRFNWQLRPPAVKGRVPLDERIVKCAWLWVNASDSSTVLGESQFYTQDIVEITALCAGMRMEQVSSKMVAAMDAGDKEEAKRLWKDFEHLTIYVNAILESHPLLRMTRWLDFAKNMGRTEEQSVFYTENARRLVTMWGPPLTLGVVDYSARVWSGLVRDFYLERWRFWFKAAIDDQKPDMMAWEENWVNTAKVLPSPKFEDVIFGCKFVLALADSINI